MAPICRDEFFSRVYYRKRRRQENGGEGVLGNGDQDSTVALKQLRQIKEEEKDLIIGDQLKGQNGKEKSQDGLVKKKKKKRCGQKGMKTERFEENGDEDGLVKSRRWSKADVSTMCHQCQINDNGRVVRLFKKGR